MLNIFDQLSDLPRNYESAAISVIKKLENYNLASRLPVINLGAKKDYKRKNLFRDTVKTKLIALPNAIGSEGMEVLESAKFV